MNPIPAGSLLHIQKHLPPGKGGQWKGRRNFQTFGKGKKASTKLQVQCIQVWKKSHFHVCEETVWRKGAMKLWKLSGLKQAPAQSYQDASSVCLCLSVHLPARESTHLLPFQLQPSPHSRVKTAGLGVCVAPAAISKYGAAWHIPQAAPIMGFAHLIFPFVELWNHRIWIATNL